MLVLRRLPFLARVAARPQIASLGTTGACKEKQLPWQLVRAPRGLSSPEFKAVEYPRDPPYYTQSRGPQRRSFVHNTFRSETSRSEHPPRRHRRRLSPLTQGAHPFSSFEKTLQGREAVEETLYIRDKEAAAKYKREAELQAERLADASKAFKKEFSQELATMLHQKHLAERQKALRK